MTLDPEKTNPSTTRSSPRTNRVRVLEYTDQPGDRTTTHEHPDSVTYALSTFRRRLHSLRSGPRRGDSGRDDGVGAGAAALRGEPGDTPSHSIFVALEEARGTAGDTYLGPD
ncbi:MAG TPA: cytoplasmic protein [Blastococcus sp.]|jgi:hypothetical protein|nr:cytoplasmic protein [Blastococcus sp.]